MQSKSHLRALGFGESGTSFVVPHSRTLRVTVIGDGLARDWRREKLGACGEEQAFW